MRRMSSSSVWKEDTSAKRATMRPQQRSSQSGNDTSISGDSFTDEGNDSYLQDSYSSTDSGDLLRGDPPSPLSSDCLTVTVPCTTPAINNSTNNGKWSTVKTFNDAIHEDMELPKICEKIINTKQFHRLRHLSQLGLCYYVYPSACHQRFEHCLGVAYLAGKYGKEIMKMDEKAELGGYLKVNIDKKDILCLQIAGLCHDLGHGPFSHAWEHFMKKFKKDYAHEEMSIKILGFIMDNGVWEMCEQEGLTSNDLIFIKECILGYPINRKKDPNADFEGRPPNKHFLYQIVANDTTKIDVDKFDYILRDCKQLNVSTSFEYKRVIKNSNVFFVGKETNGNEIEVAKASEVTAATKTVIAYRKKITNSLKELFDGRRGLHEKAYQHRVTKVIEEMVIDALTAAEPHYIVTSPDDPSKTYRLSTAYQDIPTFTKLTDNVLELIVFDNRGGDRAKRLGTDVIERNLYRCVGYISRNDDPEGQLCKRLKAIDEAIIIVSTNINYGKGPENPLNVALFFEKRKPEILFKQQFDPAPVEGRFFIVIRPRYAFDEAYTHSSKQDEDARIQELEVKVFDVMKEYGIKLQQE